MGTPFPIMPPNLCTKRSMMYVSLEVVVLKYVCNSFCFSRSVYSLSPPFLCFFSLASYRVKRRQVLTRWSTKLDAQNSCNMAEDEAPFSDSRISLTMVGDCVGETLLTGVRPNAKWDGYRVSTICVPRGQVYYSRKR